MGISNRFSRNKDQESVSDISNNNGSSDNDKIGLEGPSKLQDDVDIIDLQEALSSDNEANIEDLPDDIAELPKIVREAVTFEDDPSTPTFTFRYVLLSLIFIPPGAFLDTINSYRTTSAAYSVFFVQIASHYLGKWLAKVLPNYEVNLYFFKFNLNPGPWSIKENVLVTLTAASGATGNQGTTAISVADLYYGDKTNPAVALFFMWCINFTGYSFAAIARNFLLYDPKFIWPQALMQTNLFNSMKRADSNIKIGSKQMKVFFGAIIAMTIWQFFPEFIFPMTSSLAFLCWVAPRNEVANFIGGGLGGMGFLNISLDWSNIGSSVMLSPYWTIVVQFVAFVLGAWILIPAAKWGNLTSFKHGLMSNKLFTAEGDPYPTTELMIREGHDIFFNQTAYEVYGPLHMGAQRAWGMFFDYAAYISAISWILLFGLKDVSQAWSKFKERYTQKTTSRKENNYKTISETYSDRLNKIQSAYPDVPLWWYLVLFGITFVVLITIFATGHMFIPWYTYLVALGFGAVIVVPLGYLYAISNFQLAIGSFNELMFGLIIQSRSGGKHPASASSYGAIAGDAWYRAQYMLQDQKIGHYMHINPRHVFWSQIVGQLFGVPFNYLALRWAIDTKRDYLDGTLTDPLHQWTGQSIQSYNTMAVQYVLVGPSKLFSLSYNKIIPYGFLFGALAPVVIYALHRAFPKGKFNLWNITVFSSAMSGFYGNLSTGYVSQIIVGTISMFYFFRYRHKLWARYNYLLAAAFDTGFNLSILLIFIFFSAGKQVTMPNWWGNNADSVERCFAL
ncbi:putative oligopeptide transporter 9 [Wickerhamomyces ciferrii]|uniref:Oligopeptide transporter 9 n=1 Tax=Wickerhamomyces ciferrii (strain ATCC 14091 / BCRC 22168 / CBS 111 / JCM 3599 / NBRC 0793 / NRRL Y-1031 F-60-10) TaxID=1206466 RepID=K0KGF2_WICCF|nr:putative oligopeptide transporter 9 [Wickerhamomyces ciferrii]CCH44240.1 putative oligopeptide transporter 9 [Wickerhamomyces ciferrii]